VEKLGDYYRLGVLDDGTGHLGLTQLPLGWLFLSSSGIVSHGRIQDSCPKPLRHRL
jgi:hypothetical protein